MSDKQNVAQLPATQAPKPALAAGGPAGAIVPRDIEQAFRLATAIGRAGMAPKSYANDPNKIMVGILHGMEVGLTPMAALQSISVINGMPSVWGDGALALVRGSGLLESFSETVEGEGDAMTAVCVLRRKGEREPIVGRFSIANAKKAKLHGKSGPWQEYPDRMLKMRARSFALRDGFADVLRGLHVAEEARDMGTLQDQGDGSYAPPRPQRADYQGDHPGLTPEPAVEDEGSPAQPERTPLVDAVGEVVGEYEPEAFLEEFFAAVGDAKADRKLRAQMLRNNYETATTLYVSSGKGGMRDFLLAMQDLGFTGDDYREPKPETKDSAGANGSPAPADGEAGAVGAPPTAPAERVGYPFHSEAGKVLSTSDTPARFVAAIEDTIRGTLDEGADPKPFWTANKKTIEACYAANDPDITRRLDILQKEVFGAGAVKGKQGRMV